MSTLRPPVNNRDQQTGNLEARLTLVEYGDYQCPYCRRAHPLVLRLLKELGSELRFVFRHFPLQEIHAQAVTAAISAEAAARQGKFWPMHDLLFENQDRFHEKTIFLDLAEELGLHLDQFIIDRRDGDIASKVEKDFDSGIYSGVSRTPTFFVNESKIYTYDGSYESLLATIELLV
jgi:protein-disulfide isomerase